MAFFQVEESYGLWVEDTTARQSKTSGSFRVRKKKTMELAIFSSEFGPSYSSIA